MATEERTRGAKAPKKAAVQQEIPEWLKSRNPQERQRIIAHARKTGKPIPGIHIDRDGTSMIDTEGIQHNYLPKDSDPQVDGLTIQKLIRQGWEIQSSGDHGYNLTIPQKNYDKVMQRYVDEAVSRSKPAPKSDEIGGIMYERDEAVSFDPEEFFAEGSPEPDEAL